MARFRRIFIAGFCLLSLAGCSTQVESNPARTATEQMLISTAADRAARKLCTNLPAKGRVFVDASNFEGTDGKYAIGAIRAVLLQKGAALVDDRKKAETIIEIRSGALSTDQKSLLIGIPAFTIPLPLASGGLPIPEIAFYKDSEQKGVAKFAAIAYTAKDGNMLAVQEPQYGLSHNTDYTVLFFISWKSNDATAKEEEESASSDDQTTSN